MSNKLSTHLTQRAGLSHRLQRAINMLQKSNVELTYEIAQALEKNPLLETTNDSGAEAISHNETRLSRERGEEIEEESWIENIPDKVNILSEELEWQLSLMQLPEQDKKIGSIIIGALNTDGLLTLTLEEILGIARSISEKYKRIEKPQIERILKIIQMFHPTGVAARNLQECLILQLTAMSASTPLRKQALSVVTHHMDILAKNDLVAIGKLTKLKNKDVNDLLKLIRSLNPRPGANQSRDHTEYIAPDLVARKGKRGWEVRLNEHAIPQVSINKDYVDLLRSSGEESDIGYLKENLSEAQWLLRSIETRNSTLLSVGQFIVSYQSAFLDKGDVEMRPLNLKTIADSIEVHPSTISRITRHNFLATPSGLFPMKYFLSGNIRNVLGQGTISTTAIKSLIKEITMSEDPKKPLSDSKIVHLIEKRNIKIARRTVAKYRSLMAIPSSNQRKSLARLKL
ncbi:MAG: RNA polymerase sigma-54 factor [Gammaproteobacteria bacterium]|nr:RNA polymerase sigma-54 factor [Gammaproteobacteria bacterium]